MQQVDRYLAAVKYWLPLSQQDDILAELSEDIHSQIDELETERERTLTDAEVAAVLKKRGDPVAVASGYLPQQYLIGPALYPLYRFVLRLVIFWVQLPLFVFVAGPLNLLTAASPLGAIAQTLGNFVEAAFIAACVITVIFALVERPRLPKPLREKRTQVSDLLGAIWRIPLWIYLVAFIPRVDFNGLHIVLASIWHILFWPVLVLLIAAVPLGRRRLPRLAIDGLGLIGVAFLFTTQRWVDVTSGVLSAGVLGTATRWANLNAAVFILGAAVGIVVDAVRAWRALPQKVQNGGELPPDLRQGAVVK
jgi:hypothetical protein